MADGKKPVFLTKKQREEEALKRLQEKSKLKEDKILQESRSHHRFISGQTDAERRLFS